MAFSFFLLVVKALSEGEMIFVRHRNALYRHIVASLNPGAWTSRTSIDLSGRYDERSTGNGSMTATYYHKSNSLVDKITRDGLYVRYSPEKRSQVDYFHEVSSMSGMIQMHGELIVVYRFALMLITHLNDICGLIY